jgi:hypothetical protein
MNRPRFHYGAVVSISILGQEHPRVMDRSVLTHLSNYARRHLRDENPPPRSERLLLPAMDPMAVHLVMNWMERIHNVQPTPAFVPLIGTSFCEKVLLMEVFEKLGIRPGHGNDALWKHIQSEIWDRALSCKEIECLWDRIDHRSAIINHMIHQMAKQRMAGKFNGVQTEEIDAYVKTEPVLSWRLEKVTVEQERYGKARKRWN